MNHITFRSQNVSTLAAGIIVGWIIFLFLAGILIILNTSVLKNNIHFLIFISIVIMLMIPGAYIIRKKLIESYEYTITDTMIVRKNLKNGISETLEMKQISHFWFSPRLYRKLNYTEIYTKLGEKWLITEPPFSIKQSKDYEEAVTFFKNFEAQNKL
jgi:hypothetical protein